MVFGLWVLFIVLALGGTVLLGGLIGDTAPAMMAWLLGTLLLALLVTVLFRMRELEKSWTSSRRRWGG